VNAMTIVVTNMKQIFDRIALRFGYVPGAADRTRIGSTALLMKGTAEADRNARIEEPILQLRELRKCGISAVFRPSMTESRKRNEWCLKAVALLAGLPIGKFDEDRWAALVNHVSACEGDIVRTLFRKDGWSEAERAEFEPLLEAAYRLKQQVLTNTQELNGQTISA